MKKKRREIINGVFYAPLIRAHNTQIFTSFHKSTWCLFYLDDGRGCCSACVRVLLHVRVSLHIIFHSVHDYTKRGQTVFLGLIANHIFIGFSNYGTPTMRVDCIFQEKHVLLPWSGDQGWKTCFSLCIQYMVVCTLRYSENHSRIMFSNGLQCMVHVWYVWCVSVIENTIVYFDRTIKLENRVFNDSHIIHIHPHSTDVENRSRIMFSNGSQYLVHRCCVCVVCVKENIVFSLDRPI